MCLRPAHAGCATFLAARALEHGEEPDPRMEAGLWPATKQSVLALRTERGGVGPISSRAGRSVGQGMLAALIVGAFLVLAIARTTPTGVAGSPAASIAVAAPATQPAAVIAPASAEASALPASAASPSADPGASSSAEPSPAGAPSPVPVTPAPSASAGPGASPSGGATLAHYTVKSGDTLSSIAIAHGVSVKQLRKANGIEGTMIRPGQELVIP
jgi:LysM repeat protein